MITNINNKVNKIEAKRNKNEEEKSLFDDIDKTMVIKLENMKAYKVSPIGNNSEDDVSSAEA